MEPTDWNPGTLLGPSAHYWKTGTLHAAVKLDVVSAIGSARLPAAEIAPKCNCNQRGMEHLVDALAAMGLLLYPPNYFPAGQLSERRDRQWIRCCLVV